MKELKDLDDFEGFGGFGEFAATVPRKKHGRTTFGIGAEEHRFACLNSRSLVM